ncbi:MAG: DUF1294 domain-containing protein [Candidatus Methanomethylophilaceae archaeon]|nr:DUF1294 domain-containing protein [Candidatus Methanomethylophilaceae archaeon]
MSFLIFLVVFLILNIASFAAYLMDKRKAQKKEWRTKESTLLLFGLVGPFGAVAGMEYARHKTQKAKFKLNYVFLGIHLILIALMFVNGWIHF